jgi:exonuclease III
VKTLIQLIILNVNSIRFIFHKKMDDFETIHQIEIEIDVVGLQHYKQSKKIQEKDVVTLEKEPDNKYDHNAICVKNDLGEIIGYLKKFQAAIIQYHPISDAKIKMISENIIKITMNMYNTNAQQLKRICKVIEQLGYYKA